jgi:flagellar assembly protein FliH
LSSRFIPRDQLKAVSPWQIASLDTVRNRGNTNPEGNEGAAGREVSKAREEGFQHGLEVGYSKAEAAARRHDQEFNNILAGIAASAKELDESVASEIIDLAVALARQVVRTHVTVNKEAILPVVRESLNSIVDMAQHPRLSMHPEDIDVVKRELSDELIEHCCRLAPDDQIARGGVRIEDATYELDATLATRWNRALASLGLKNEWLG